MPLNPLQMCISKQDLCNLGMAGRASHWGWPQEALEKGAVLHRMFSTKHQHWDLWFYHIVDLSSRCCYVADVSSGDQLWVDKNSLLGPSFECLSTITHNAFMCVNTEARGVWVGLRGSFFMFWWHSRFGKFPKWRPQSRWNSKLLLLIRFSKLLPRGRRRWGVSREGGGNQESLKRFKKVLKISKQHLWCQSKGPWMKKPRYAVNSSENTLDKAAVHAKSVPQSDPINRATCRNH